VRGARPAAAVSLGDSFISGEGAGGGYGASAANGCHRSRSAPIRSATVAATPIRSARIANLRPLNLACSGARVANVWRASRGGLTHRGEPPQADRLAALARRFDVRLVVLTVGANDLGFARLVFGCALRWAAASLLAWPGCRKTAGEKLAAALPGAGRGLRKAIRELRRALAGAGEPRGGYRLIVMSYASPLPAGAAIRYPQRGWARLTKGGCPLTDADADWAKRDAVPAIAAMMRRAAAATGAEFLDVSHALDGHEACARGSEWFRGLDLCCERSPRESLHPNPYGQRALGICIALAYAAPPGNHACVNTPDTSYATGMRLLPGGL
jgi:lysophospholipase L1-like esterase